MMKDQNEAERFLTLCLEDEEFIQDADRSGINVYNEKRLHRILKKTMCDDENCHEVRVGKYIADILCGDRIIEIQCGSLYPLADKIRYYLENTDYDITVVHPLMASKKIIRAERETGEVLRARRSAKKESAWSVLPDMIYISDFVGSSRFHLRLMLISADEYRFSERVRYRKKGAFDSELYPRELLGSIDFFTKEEYTCFLPDVDSFDAAEYSKFSKIKGRDLYLALNFLCNIQLLEKKKEGRKYVYSKK